METSHGAAAQSAEISRQRQEFYGRAAQHNLAPLWEVAQAIVPPLPSSPCVPALWRYADARPYLLEASRLISAAEAQRRVLILENPGLPGQSRITPSLYAGLQIVMPGEIAPAHRHTPAALRFVVESSRGAYTAVGGERTLMAAGDFVITPSWSWHDHGNESADPVIWIDGLDMHMINLFDASFFEQFGDDRFPVKRPEGSALVETGNNLLPVNFVHRGQTSPIFNYPYTRTREALTSLTRHQEPDRYDGYKMKYVNPLNGDWAMPTIATCMQLLPKGFVTASYRSTAGTVFAVVEGEGETVVGETRLKWGPRDTFVVPGWRSHQHRADAEAVLFSFSDRAAQERLDIFREERG
jgi:gentisate 1,2-dioxygenase